MESFYFDYNATAPLCASARDAWVEASRKHWHNPSSLYREAASARRALEDAREDLADHLDVEPERVVFNSGATEGCNAILQHFAFQKMGAIAVSAIEHPCVADAAERHLGERLRVIPVDEHGVLQLEALAILLREGGVDLVSVMAANNETGVIQPWQEVGELCRTHGVAYHCDASQWVGKAPLDGLGECDYLTATAHKFGGPKGCGFLIRKEGDDAPFSSMVGGAQEGGFRGGTEDYPAVAAMLAALEECGWGGGCEATDRLWFEEELRRSLPEVTLVGEQAERLWNTVMIIVPKEKNLRWLTRLSDRGFAVSTGSACSAGKDNPSRVLLAMGYGYDAMSRALRISGGPHTTRSDWEALLAALVSIRKELQGETRPSGVRKISLTDF